MERQQISGDSPANQESELSRPVSEASHPRPLVYHKVSNQNLEDGTWEILVKGLGLFLICYTGPVGAGQQHLSQLSSVFGHRFVPTRTKTCDGKMRNYGSTKSGKYAASQDEALNWIQRLSTAFYPPLTSELGGTNQ